MDDAGNPEQVRSAAVGPVPERDNNEVMGTIEVSAQGGGMIEVHAEISGYANNLGDVDGLPSQSEERWQWLRNGQPIDGATDEGSYLVPVDDIGAEISLRLQFTDDLGFEEELFSNQTDPVPSGPVIMAPTGYYFDDNEATVETLTVDFSRLDYLGMPTNRSYEYLWRYTTADGSVSNFTPIPQTYGDGMGGQIDRGAGHDTGATFTLTSDDAGKYIHLEVTINDADDGDAFWEKKYANGATPAIEMRPPVEAPANVAASVPSGGGSVTVNWGLTALGGAAPTSFEYRYKPTALLPFTDADYWIALAGSGTRSLTLEGDLINNAPYTFEVRSKTALVDGVADYVEATYLHKTKACP